MIAEWIESYDPKNRDDYELSRPEMEFTHTAKYRVKFSYMS